MSYFKWYFEENPFVMKTIDESTGQKLYPGEYERISIFFDVLNEQQVKCPNALKAYAHLRSTLKKVEKQLVPQHSGMIIPETDRLTLIEISGNGKKHELYYALTTDHLILLSKTGAYAIYEREGAYHHRKAIFDIEYYRTHADTAKVMIENQAGESLW